MSEFEPGDVVRCIDATGLFYTRPGRDYIISDVSPQGRVQLAEAPESPLFWFRPERFALAGSVNTAKEVRTTSSSGGVKGVKSQRYDLLPRAALDGIAEVLAHGALKYDSHNWRKGYEWGKSYSAAMRHLTAHWDGETLDDESGLPHLAHAGCHILFMLTWLHEQGEGSQFDDRFVKPSNES